MNKIVLKIINRCNKLLYHVFSVFRVDSKKIAFESDGDFSDNSYALFEFMKDNDYLEKYKIVWFVRNPKDFMCYQYANTIFVQKSPKKIDLRYAYHLATCTIFFCSHVNLLAYVKKRKKQKIVYLSHGCGIKAQKGEGNIKTPVDEVYVTGKLYLDSQAKWCNCSINKVLDIGFPRLDYFYKDINIEQKKFKEKLAMAKYESVFLWMPTFRKSVVESLSEEYANNITGLPILESLQQMNEFDKFLKSKNVMCIIKIHRLQAQMEVFKNSYNNIAIIQDVDLINAKLQLYQMIILTDCLITDYSSVASDFMLLNRPIIYTLDDYEEYKAGRGFYPEDPIDRLVGEHVYNYNEFIGAIKRIADKEDKYIVNRLEKMASMHTYQDGCASRRIIEHLKL